MLGHTLPQAIAPDGSLVCLLLAKTTLSYESYTGAVNTLTLPVHWRIKVSSQQAIGFLLFFRESRKFQEQVAATVLGVYQVLLIVS